MNSAPLTSPAVYGSLGPLGGVVQLLDKARGVAGAPFSQPYRKQEMAQDGLLFFKDSNGISHSFLQHPCPLNSALTLLNYECNILLMFHASRIPDVDISVSIQRFKPSSLSIEELALPRFFPLLFIARNTYPHPC